MEISGKNKYFQDIGNELRRQYIDAESANVALREAIAESDKFKGSMSWKTVHGIEYLTKTYSSSQKSLGKRSPETESIYSKFIANKHLASERKLGLLKRNFLNERMNRALRLGRAPDMMVEILNKLEQHNLSNHFMVIGTHALYAYEAAAGVRIVPSGALETKDVDLLWDTRRRASFAASMAISESSMIGILKSVDRSFRISHEDKYKAVNKDGFEVDIIRREASEGDPHPMRITENEDDFWAVQAVNAGQLISSPKFSSMVVSTSGKMAMMHTVHPLVFSRFKKWMSELSDRDPLKRSRDLLQSVIVEELVEEYLPNLKNPGEQKRPSI